MKSALNSLDVHFLVRELQGLVGSRLDKAYQGLKERRRDLTLQLHQKDAGKRLVRILLPGLVYVAEQKPAYATMPGHFAIFLRRRVGNARLVAVRQRGFERIIEFVLENKNGQFVLVLELLPPGNTILLDQEGKIINLLEPQRFSKRVLRGGVVYEAPEQQFDTSAATQEEIVERLFTSDKDAIVKAIAMDLGLGGAYAEEVCARAGIEKSRNDLSKEELKKVAATVTELLHEESKPFVTTDAAYPVAMKTQEAGTVFSSFSAAIATLVPDSVVEKREAAVKVKKDKAADVVKQQEAALRGLLKSAEENQRKGELLYEHYQEVAGLLKEVAALRKTHGWPEIKKLLKEKDIGVNEQKGELTVELE